MMVLLLYLLKLMLYQITRLSLSKRIKTYYDPKSDFNWLFGCIQPVFGTSYIYKTVFDVCVVFQRANEVFFRGVLAVRYVDESWQKSRSLLGRLVTYLSPLVTICSGSGLYTRVDAPAITSR